MYIIEMTYKVPASEIDEHMGPHMEFLEKYYNSGRFIASGRKEPRDGGIILAKKAEGKSIEDIIAEDPFYQRNLADYRVIEFKPTKKVKAFDAVIEEEE